MLDSRKEKILGILKEKEKIQVGELKEFLPDVSKRTLRRDFDQLLKLELVERIGERNDTFYKLK
ncbi:DeoR family transcriptional regulator [Patescibacteria group bacterium]|nr:DeoR family transcriptional regulator [Patescibacteria group bacterium]